MTALREAYRAKKDFENARKAFQQALKLEPNNVWMRATVDQRVGKSQSGF